MVPVSPALSRVYDGIHKSRILDKLASVASGEELEQVLAAKAANDAATFELAKQAALLETGMNAARKFVGTPFGKGMAVAGGAAIPAVMAGNAIADHATASARDRALQTGVGLAGLGATMYGLHRFANRGQKVASDVTEIQAALEKLAAVGYLDELLTEIRGQDGSLEFQKLASELRDLNREYGVEILVGLTEKDAGVAGELTGHVAGPVEQIMAKLRGLKMPAIPAEAAAPHAIPTGALLGAVPGAAIGATNEDHPIGGALFGALAGGTGGVVLGDAAGHALRAATRSGNPKYLGHATGALAGAAGIGALEGWAGRNVRTPAEQVRHDIKRKLGLK